MSEGATLMVALNAIRKGAKEANMSLYEYGNINQICYVCFYKDVHINIA